MALIGKIRNNSWLLIVLIGLGLGGFIIMDMTSGQQSAFGSDQFTLGEIEGQKVDWNNFYRTEQILFGNSAGDVYSRRNFLWDYFVEEALVQQEAEALGLGISKEELLDLEFGPNPSPIIRQNFQNPNAPGQLDREQLNFIKQLIQEDRIDEAIQNQQLSPNFRSIWLQQEKRVIKDRLQSKLNALVTKAVYTPTWMAEMGHAERNQRIEFAYVKVPFDELDNTEVTLEDSDFKTYIEENEATLRQDEETRKVQYTIFDVFPTAEDSTAIRQQVVNLMDDMQTAESDSLFALRNDGTFDNKYFNKNELSPIIADTAFQLSVGSVYGPYQEAGAYKAMKVIDRKVIPDSVRARHILLPVNNQQELIQAKGTLDSLQNLIETGQSTFDSLATVFGTDGTRTKGGDLGYAGPGQMVKPFNDLIFFEAEENELNIVGTQFGLHLVEVTGRKYINNTEGVKVSYISRAIEPSEDTQDAVYREASAFVAENQSLESMVGAALASEKLSIETSAPLKKNDFQLTGLGAGQSSRDIVRWAFGADKGDVSPEIYAYEDPVNFYNNKYVVVGLKTVIGAGLPALDEIREEIEQAVINQKKGQIIKDRMQGNDLNAIASEFDLEVDTATNVTFAATTVPGVGAEPEVIATAFNLDQGQTSEPIIGVNGVFVIKVTNKPALAAANNIPQVRQQISSATRSKIGPSVLLQAMRKNADIEDNRFRFY